MIVHLTVINIYQCATGQILKQLQPTLKMKEDFYVFDSPLLISIIQPFNKTHDLMRYEDFDFKL